MAIVRPGFLVQSISGNLQAVNFRNTGTTHVVGRVPNKPKPITPEMLERRARLDTLNRHWKSLSANQKAAWSEYAKRITRTNRVGVRGHYSAREAFIALNLLWEPKLVTGYVHGDPPRLTRLPAPIPQDATWAAAGPYNVTIAAAPPTTVSEYIFIQRYAQYGPRGARGAYAYIPKQNRGGLTLNWYTQFSLAGELLNAGEQVLCTMYWYKPNRFPSPYGRFRVTVT